MIFKDNYVNHSLTQNRFLPADRMRCFILLFYVFAPTRQKEKKGEKRQAATHSSALTGWQEMSDTTCCEGVLLLPECHVAVRQPKERVSVASASRHT